MGKKYVGDVGLVPSVVVDDCGSVGHAGDLIAVVPPAEHFGVLFGVLTEPVVGLPVIVDDVAAAVAVGVAHYDCRVAVGLGCAPGPVENEQTD